MPYLALLLSALIAAPAASPAPEPTPAEAATNPPENADKIAIGDDGRERMTVEISIDGKGPYDFLVDTGAERTVISRELANRLALEDGPSARLASMTGVQDVGTVVIPQIQVSRQSLRKVHAPALREANIGASGMLGIDMLKAQRVTFDFERNQMSLSPSRHREAPKDSEEIVVTARTRLGRLVLVNASLNGKKLIVILDTGSEVTIGNEALRRRLAASRRFGPLSPIELVSVTGSKFTADSTAVEEVRLGGVQIKDLPVAFADVHPFKLLDLTDRPALLLGMDALKLFDRVLVDFARREVRFFSRDVSQLRQSTRVAARSGF